MPTFFRAPFMALTVLLLAPLFATAQIRCNAALSSVEKLTCADPDLHRLDLALQNVYGALQGVTKDKQSLAQAQRRWLASLGNSCKSRDCVAKAYSARAQALSSKLLSQVKVHTAPLSNAQAVNACVELAALADHKELSKHALWGHAQWDIKLERREELSAWTLSESELERLKARDSYETSNRPSLVYRVRLNNRDEPTRFGSFETGGTCASTQVFNVSHLLSTNGDDVGVDTVPDPDDEMRWIYWGGGDYPVLYRGRNFMMTSALGNPNSLNMISWIKSDGRIRPLCMLGATNVRRIPRPSYKAAICQAIATGQLRPLTWKPVTETLPINHESAVYRVEFERRYGRYADSVGLLQIDFNGDGSVENLARFEYSSGAGCGSTYAWMSALSKNLDSVAKDPLNILLEKIGDGATAVYEQKGRYYVHTSSATRGDALISLRGERLERICEFEWKSKSVVSKFFPVEQ